ncbi:MAG TPA: hypothetical protein VKK79_05075 [Candidatus Lokiarchaeia archaeon]|nr:hypothetical protein [Candidatus Lokiarchaeia archaeon]
MSQRPDIVTSANAFLLRLGISIALFVGGILYVGFPIAILPFVTLLETGWMWGVFTVLIGLFLLAWKEMDNRGGLVIVILFLAAFVWILYSAFIRPDIIAVFPIAGTFGWVMAVFFALLVFPWGINFLIHTIAKFRRHLPLKEVFAITWRHLRRSRRHLIVSAVLIIGGVSVTGVLSANVPVGQIIVQPQNYQVKFAFWGSGDPSRYDNAQLAALNKYNVTIATYTTGYPSTPVEQAAFVAVFQWWLKYYPNVSFLPAVPGIPGGAVWDGSAVGTTEAAKNIIRLVQANNLTNVRGLAFDWEEPSQSDLGGQSSDPNSTRHEGAVATWNAFFDWVDANAPGMFLSNINYIGDSVDPFDGDADLQYINKAVVTELPRWSEIAPMIYRCGYQGTKPFGDVPQMAAGIQVASTYDFYLQVKAHAEAMERVYGNATHTGVYIGITNCTCYGRDVEVYEFGKYLGHGYDVLVQDARICKSFGIPTITIFILTTEVENGYSMGGVFDSYGDDFLDRFNTDVNGPASTEPIAIPAGNLHIGTPFFPDSCRDYLLDLLYNFNRLSYLLPFLGAIVVICWLVFRAHLRSLAPPFLDDSIKLNARN